ncbi:dihydropteroate synthase [Puia sp. P3]|uniref:dihydropteroate synthase n=1 Tax=Puia sp. P3 TaxID=3423952 RepID=UPI003D6698E5
MITTFTLNARGKLLTIDRPQVMGIINSTTDSFYSGSRFTKSGPLLQEVAKMVEQGVDWLDIGGQSTRPGAADIGEEEEMRRVVDAIGLIHQRWPGLLLSVDTGMPASPGRPSRQAPPWSTTSAAAGSTRTCSVQWAL